MLERRQIQSEWLNAGQCALCEVEFINQNENNKGKGLNFSLHKKTKAHQIFSGIV